MLADPKRGVPLWRAVARRLTEGSEAAQAWRLLRPSTADEVLALVTMVRQAVQAAAQEVARPKAKQERDDIKDVIKKAEALALAIRISSLPGGVNYGYFELEPSPHSNLPPVGVDIGWHSTSAEHSLSGYCISVDDMLKWAIERASQHLDTLPIRAGQRASGGEQRATVKTFARHLASYFGHHFGEERRGAIARVAAAVYALPDAPDHADIEARLKDRPAVLDTRPKRRKISDRPG